MSSITKEKVSITLDKDVFQLLKRLESERSVKLSSYVNRVMRRHFIRPGKGMETFALQESK